MMARWPADPEDRLWSGVDVQSPGCWVWTRSLRNGYGNIRWEGRTTYTHRLVWELLVGPIPQGMELDHLCRNTHCCNPDHLEPVTHAENMRRGAARHQMIARNEAITHCAQGHAFAGINLLVSSGQRRCRTCTRQRSREYRARRAAA